MMNHKEALRVAMKPTWFPDEEFVSGDMIDELEKEATEVIRAYLDARGLVMVSMEPTAELHDAANKISVYYDDFAIGDGNVTLGISSHPQTFKDVWSELLAAAPDPFKDGE